MAKKKYDVGYKRPPQDTRFQPGQSGNPSGRPKGSKNKRPFHPLQGTTIYEMQKQIVDAGLKQVQVVQDGQSTSMSKIDAMMVQLYNKAMSGHVGATKLLMQWHFSSLESMAEGAKTLHRTTLEIREKERKKIFTPVPKPDTYGTYYEYIHKICSARFAMRELYGLDEVPTAEYQAMIGTDDDEVLILSYEEPEIEEDWSLFNFNLQNDYSKYGHLYSEMKIPDVPSLFMMK